MKMGGKNAPTRLLILAVAAFVVFWTLVLTGSMPTPKPVQAAHNAEPHYTANCYRSEVCPWWDYSGAWNGSFSFVLAISTTGLWYFTWRSAEASAKSVKLARSVSE